jgi:thiol-disulfide isomerase/thioredoxin
MKNLLYLLLVTYLAWPLKCNSQIRNTNITGRADFLKNGDKVILTVYPLGIIEHIYPFFEQYQSTVSNGIYHFSPTGKATLQNISIQFPIKNEEDLMYYTVPTADSLELTMRQGNIQVKQTRDSSFIVQYRIKKIENKLYESDALGLKYDMSNIESVFKNIDSLKNTSLSLIEQNKSTLSSMMYTCLKQDAIIKSLDLKYSQIADNRNTRKEKINYSGGAIVKEYLQTHPITEVDLNSIYPIYPLLINYVYNKFIADDFVLNGKNFDPVSAMSNFVTSYSGTLRELLLVKTIIQARDFNMDFSLAVKNNLKYILEPENVNYVENVLSRLEGALAYNFSLVNKDNKKVELNDFKGKVIVLDFWYTGCGNCARLAPHMRKLEKEFKNKSVVFIGVGIDKQKNQWLKSVNSNVYTSPDIVNLYTGGNGAKDPVLQHYHVSGYPTLVLISKSGKVVNLKPEAFYDGGVDLREKISSCL